MKCPHCNQEHPDDYKFCPATGKKIETLQACSNPECYNYGKHIIPIDSSFCPTCGHSLANKLPTPVDILKQMDFRFDEVVFFRLIFIKGNQNLPDFYMSEAPITQGIWDFITRQKDKIANDHPRRGVNYPMFSVSIQDAEQFIYEFNQLFLKKMKQLIVFKEYIIKRFALPNETQWEYVANEANKSNFTYSGSNNIEEVAWYIKNSDSHIHEIKTKMPNALGVYDMSGNIAEWCRNTKSNGYVIKGGSWNSYERNCRIDNHECVVGKQCSSDQIGFRVVLELERR